MLPLLAKLASFIACCRNSRHAVRNIRLPEQNILRMNLMVQQ
jgi:hypothetical protein